ncbi:MAG: hypothetical protein IPP12_12185 [Nitrospira sp.]|nr:hypothetical protein [Nitrospira sp.]
MRVIFDLRYKLLKKSFRQGRKERASRDVRVWYVEGLERLRTQPEGFFSSLQKEKAFIPLDPGTKA